MSDKLITVARFSYLHRAYLMKGWLDSAGIESCILNQGLRYAIRSEAQNRVELQVREGDVEKALEIIDQVNEKYGPEFQEPDDMVSAIRRILVPIDFSPFAMNAARYAVHVAKQKQAEIVLVHAFFNPIVSPWGYDNTYIYPSSVTDALHEIEEHATRGMTKFVSELRQYMEEKELFDVTLTTRLVGGIAEETILELAESDNFDLIVLGAKGKSRSDYWYGSVTAKIMQKAKIPVLAIPEKSVYKDEMFKRIMYATNFDKSDGPAIRMLLNIARPLDVHVHVVHIDTTSENPFANYDLNHFKEKYAGIPEDVPMDFDLIKNDNQVKGIEQYIKEKEIDIISLTTHKRNLITSILKPSVARELLFHTSIPLLVFHSKD